MIQMNKANKVVPEDGKFVAINTENVFVTELGPSELEPLIFVSGISSASEVWGPTMQLLAKQGFRCIAIDLPPFGYTYSETATFGYDRRSQSRRILAVLEKLNVRIFTLVGHSFTGRAAVTTALAAPARIRRLILVNPAMGYGRDEKKTRPNPVPRWVSSLIASNFINQTIASIAVFPYFARKSLEFLVSNPMSLTNEVENGYKRPLTVEGKSEQLGSWLEDVVTSSDHQLIQDRSVYQGYRTPTFLIWGERDRITPLWQAEEVKAMMPTSRIIIMKGVGHLPMVEDREGLADTLTTILRRM